MMSELGNSEKHESLNYGPNHAKVQAWLASMSEDERDSFESEGKAHRVTKDGWETYCASQYMRRKDEPTKEERLDLYLKNHAASELGPDGRPWPIASPGYKITRKSVLERCMLKNHKHDRKRDESDQEFLGRLAELQRQKTVADRRAALSVDAPEPEVEKCDICGREIQTLTFDYGNGRVDTHRMGCLICSLDAFKKGEEPKSDWQGWPTEQVIFFVTAGFLLGGALVHVLWCVLR